jgi:hypothetical protein
MLYVKNVPPVERVIRVLMVHEGFVDGSGWQGAYNILKKDGYNVTIVQNPTISLSGDVAITSRAIAAQPNLMSRVRSICPSEPFIGQ